MGPWNAFLQALPQAASSPFALIGYLAVLTTFVFYLHGKQKAKRTALLLAKAKTPAERTLIFQREYSEVPRDGLSEQNFLRLKKLKFLILFVITCLILGTIIILTAMNNSKVNAEKLEKENSDLKEQLKVKDDLIAKVVDQNGKLTNTLNGLSVRPTAAELHSVEAEREALVKEVAELKQALASATASQPEALTAVRDAEATIRRAETVNQLKQIGLALHNYASTQGKLDMANWRSSILPYMEQDRVFTESPNNNPYRLPGRTGDDTGYVAISDAKKLTNYDGTANQVLVIAYDKPGIRWDKPGDITIEQAIDYIKSRPSGHRVPALRADCSVVMISPTTSLDTLKSVFGEGGLDLLDGKPDW